MIRQVTEAAMEGKRVGGRKGKRKPATGRGGNERWGKGKKGEGGEEEKEGARGAASKLV